jgi:hypothetical protein
MIDLVSLLWKRRHSAGQEGLRNRKEKQQSFHRGRVRVLRFGKGLLVFLVADRFCWRRVKPPLSEPPSTGPKADFGRNRFSDSGAGSLVWSFRPRSSRGGHKTHGEGDGIWSYRKRSLPPSERPSRLPSLTLCDLLSRSQTFPAGRTLHIESLTREKLRSYLQSDSLRSRSTR